MNNQKRILYFLAVGLLSTHLSWTSYAGSGAEISTCGPETNGLALCAAAPHSVYQMLEPIVLRLVVTNSADEARILAVGRPELLYRIDVRYGEQEIVPMTRYGRKMTSGTRQLQPKPWGVAAHGVHEDRILLNRYFDFSLPGRYHINILRVLSLPMAPVQIEVGVQGITLSVEGVESSSSGAWGAR